ncbi:hypothetical protein F511_15339 [Dorcoceras hygrometricum]|uniref:25S rRNA (uridine-N(3))-methyltransferase BMT5-like domain-containing protein n=1 Tax=Dorcoceras hygrometricum TaxID=472368 RepID=A0A2Z7CPX6_9LAMI|nr:hypothetical protein F511_15339 [Dorcoceras hygrometricum]
MEDTVFLSGTEKKEAGTWIKHYSSHHSILLVGEGDFSFAACLARAFRHAYNIVATSLDTEEVLAVKHPTAAANLVALRNNGCTVIHGVNASTMSEHPRLKNQLFDRIVFNFPHAGFDYKEHHPMQIQLHQEVVRGFLRNAARMLMISYREKGQVHITHKTAYPFSAWEIEKLGKDAGLEFIEAAPFDLWDYPGYLNKRGGDGYNSNDTFPVGLSCTYKFEN